MNKVIGFILVFSVFIGAEAKSYSKYGKNADEIVSGAKELRINENLAIPTYIEFREDARPDFNNWINYFKSSFQLENDYSFELLSSSTDKIGNSHHRYVQTYNGIAIEFAHFIIHTIGDKVKSMNGVAFKQQDMTKSATISFQEGLNISTASMGASAYKWESVEEENHLKWEEGNPHATYLPTGELVYIHKNANINSSQIRLARKYNVYALDPLGRIEFYIDALNGEVLFENELIHTTNKPGIAHTGYSGTRNIVADSIGDNLFRLRETTRGNGISTFDMNKSTQHSQGVDFIDSNNVWNNFNADLDQYAGDAHWGAEVMYDYLDVVHQRNSIDGNGFALLSYVHYGNQYNNAFWDGQRMTYGDGNATNTPLTSIDIAGHEIAHGLTNFTAGLLYRSESGALNESFSDIFGAAVESYGRPTNWNWFMGEDIGSAFRNMSNPNQFGHPDTYDGVNWISQNCTPTRNNDWCGVHTNSGVQNYWFYLLTQGGSGVNDIGDTFSVAGLGIIPAAEIAFRNLTVYLGPNSNHDDARFYAIKSAIDLHGGCSYEVEQVTNAWYAVGVGGAYTPGVDADFVATYDTVYCSVPALVDFTSNSNNVSTFKWLFGDGDSSNLPTPSHLYTSPGLYSVSLYVDGGVCGADSLQKVGYINIDTNNFCSYSMDRNATLIVNDCDGRLYDNGGLNGDYELQSYDTIIIEPSGNVDFIYLLIDSLNIEEGYGSYCNHDYLEVFDGGSTEARSLGRFCSANLPPDTIMSSSPKLTIVLSSDDLVQRYGFVAEWFCQTASQAPIANFSVQFDSTCNGFNSFKDLSSNGVNSWMWDFGDGNTSMEQNPTHVYETNGVYNVTLTASNTAGNDMRTKMSAIVVNRPLAPVVLNDTNCVNADFKLAATGNGTLNWYTDLLNNQLAFVGDTFRLDTIKSDTSFYVSSFVQQPRVIGTPFFINGTGVNSDTTAELYFDVMKPTLLESVIIRSIRRGDRVVDLKNSRGEIIDSRVVNVPNVPSQVQLNFEIPPGTGYSLSIANRNPSAYINYTGATYPYQFGNFMTLTGSSLGSSAYPFFYYMIARELPCLSPRAKVSAIVDTTCTIITSLDDIQQIESATKVYPNPFSESFVISRTSTKKYDYELLDLVGKVCAKKENVNVQKEQVSLVGLPNGIYLLRITEGTSSTIQKLVKH